MFWGAFLVPKDCFHAFLGHIWQKENLNFWAYFKVKNHGFDNLRAFCWLFFQNYVLSQKWPKSIKKCFSRLFEFQKIIFIQFSAILDNIQIKKFWTFLSQNITIFEYFGLFWQLFFLNGIFVQNGQQNTNNRFFTLFQAPNIIFMQ